jgi:hypothetical protein
MPRIKRCDRELIIGRQAVDLGRFLSRPFTGIAVTIVACTAMYRVGAFQLAKSFLALAHVTPAFLVGFGLAGGGKIHRIASDPDGQCDDIDCRSRDAALEQQHGHGAGHKAGGASHPWQHGELHMTAK